MQTEFTTNNALAVKLWHEKLYRDARKEAYFERFMGESPDNIVQVKTDLEKNSGDKITFGIRMRLSGTGVTGDNILEGNEESLVTYDYAVTIDQLRHGVRSKGMMSDRRVLFSVPDESRDALKIWMGERIDKECFDALGVSPSKTFFAGAATSDATLAATELITPNLITKIKAWAMTGGNRTQPPLNPVRIKGKMYYVLVIHPDQAYDLRVDSTWTQAQRDAQERSGENPIFTGALGIWSGVVVHEHENIPIANNYGSGSNVSGAKAIFMGAQGLCWAWGKRPFVKEETFDYSNQRGHAIGMIFDTAKPVFNSKDFGSIQVTTARTKISDA